MTIPLSSRFCWGDSCIFHRYLSLFSKHLQTSCYSTNIPFHCIPLIFRLHPIINPILLGIIYIISHNIQMAYDINDIWEMINPIYIDINGL